MRRRWRVRWVNDRDNPFVWQAPAHRRMSHTRAGLGHETCACHHVGHDVTRTALGPAPVLVFLPPEGCNQVFYTSTYPPSKAVAYAAIEELMTGLGR